MKFLEREDNEFLLNFYTRNHFKPFDMRTTVHTCRFTTLFLAKLISFGTERQFVKRDTRNQKLIASGAHSSAIIYSIAETAKANNLNPYDYFVYLLEETPKHMDNTDHSFLMICYHGHQIYLTEFTRTDTQGCHEAALNFL